MLKRYQSPIPLTNLQSHPMWPPTIPPNKTNYQSLFPPHCNYPATYSMHCNNKHFLSPHRTTLWHKHQPSHPTLATNYTSTCSLPLHPKPQLQSASHSPRRTTLRHKHQPGHPTLPTNYTSGHSLTPAPQSWITISQSLQRNTNNEASNSPHS